MLRSRRFPQHGNGLTRQTSATSSSRGQKNTVSAECAQPSSRRRCEVSTRFHPTSIRSGGILLMSSRRSSKHSLSANDAGRNQTQHCLRTYLLHHRLPKTRGIRVKKHTEFDGTLDSFNEFLDEFQRESD